MNILITGDGYLTNNIIGLMNEAHCCHVISRSLGQKNTIRDLNFSSESPAVKRIEVDLNDTATVKNILKKYKIELVMHLARAREACQSTIAEDDLSMTKSLLEAMNSSKVRQLIFTSSAAIYGTRYTYPVDENSPPLPATHYAMKKLEAESYLASISQTHPDWSILCLRFFNLAGGNFDLHGKNNGQSVTSIFVKIARAAATGEPLKLEGDFSRDYIHVMDAASSLLAGVKYVRQNRGVSIINVGSGAPTKASELIKTFERISGKSITVEFDEPNESYNMCIANINKSREHLKFSPCASIEDICQSEWHNYLRQSCGK